MKNFLRSKQNWNKALPEESMVYADGHVKCDDQWMESIASKVSTSNQTSVKLLAKTFHHVFLS